MIRSASTNDAERIAEIYGYYVKTSAVTFEHDAPSVDEIAGRIARTLERYPYLVVEDNGDIRGFAYAGPLRTRKSYDRSCEVTIYLDRDAKKKGFGRALYDELEKRLCAQGILNLYACVADPDEEDEYLTRNSEHFHAHMGFEKAGTFHKCGHKFGRWYNIVWMEKIIGAHD